MNRLWKPLKKIGERLVHIKDKNIEKYARFNIYCQDESRFGLLTLAHKARTRKGVKPCAIMSIVLITLICLELSLLSMAITSYWKCLSVTAVPSRPF